ncbi:DUF5333 domain-containing protein [Shimia thalassica]|jgi:uncharacterized membrane protein|uniref:NADH dehydrogenase subunit E n=1 Tax=Shimia thalassica TaxID=1715693 RepID=A0A0P1I9M9_9RHOB|nr:DUF5333 domain-containing protein [Shimia thalassica]MBU2944105.1 DUF5333 domain-containing protein [Shimia thalassica]MDO6483299.1 DUF5333 domain-containing protein [Shimia thalassica]MDO6503618.1 DUF5333 domain-containing protein [Shimia thalassica]MDO6798476.1 DUF5333 domain-containing protein [Shimia thalassica]MDP2494998.1 DUF5333 domain-containing protein [Shimia thalassica]
MRKVLLAASAVFAVTGSAAQAKAPMSDVPEIENVLYAAAVAYEISEICDDISARRMKALGDAWKLRSIANDLGYSDSEIKEYIESDAQKARMRAKGEAYLKSKGAIYGQPETFCAVGRAEIAKSSAIGALLRAK